MRASHRPARTSSPRLTAFRCRVIVVIMIFRQHLIILFRSAQGSSAPNCPVKSCRVRLYAANWKRCCPLGLVNDDAHPLNSTVWCSRRYLLPKIYFYIGGAVPHARAMHAYARTYADAWLYTGGVMEFAHQEVRPIQKIRDARWHMYSYYTYTQAVMGARTALRRARVHVTVQLDRRRQVLTSELRRWDSVINDSSQIPHRLYTTCGGSGSVPTCHPGLLIVYMYL